MGLLPNGVGELLRKDMEKVLSAFLNSVFTVKADFQESEICESIEKV